MIAVDTNILIYAHRIESPWHGAAKAQMGSLVTGAQQWALPWPCLHEFLGMVSHPRIYKVPTPMTLALDQVRAWSKSARCFLIGETDSHLEMLAELAIAAHLAGPKVHDAKIAAICLDHGVSELWTADRDFSRFPALKTRNPLVT